MFEEIEGVVEITGDLYVKTPEALETLLGKLREIGYQIDNHRDEKYRQKNKNVSIETMQKKGMPLWFAKIDVYRGKCLSCNGLIDIWGIETHGHKCELCGEVTYYEIIDGSEVRFSFIQRDGKEHDWADITMKAKRWDTENGYLYFYNEPLTNRWLKTEEQFHQFLNENNDKWEYVEEENLIRVKYPQPWNSQISAINPAEISNSYRNHKIVKVWEGKEYGKYDQDFPLQESISIFEIWHWAPLKPSPKLHEKIIHAARMSTDCGKYYQNGSKEFGEVQIARMRKFVEHCTDLDLEKWDETIKDADKSGPGMIKAIAKFCHPQAEVENLPNLGNLLIGFNKMCNGQATTEGEDVAMQDALQDSEICKSFFEILADLKL